MPPPTTTQGRGRGDQPGRGRSRHGRRRNPHLRTTESKNPSAGWSHGRKHPLKGHGGDRNPYPEGGRRGGGGRRRARRPRYSCRRRRRRRLHRWRGEAWWVLLRAVLGRRPGKIRGGWNRVELSSLRLLARGDWCCLFCLFLLSFDPLL